MPDAGTDVTGQRLGCTPGQTFQCMDMGWPGVYGAAFHDANSTDDGVKNPPAWFGSLVQQQRDQSGLLYRRNRYYDPATGRFTQQDPIGLAGGLNLYGFANGDPVNFSDPFGLCPIPPSKCLDVAFLALDVVDFVRNPSWGTGAGVGLGLAALIPGVPNVNAAKRGGRAAAQAGRTVIGHYPGYLRLADEVGGRRFNIPERAWAPARINT